MGPSDEERKAHNARMKRAVCPFCRNHGPAAITYHPYGVGFSNDPSKNLPLYECTKCQHTFDPASSWTATEDGYIKDETGKTIAPPPSVKTDPETMGEALKQAKDEAIVQLRDQTKKQAKKLGLCPSDVLGNPMVQKGIDDKAELMAADLLRELYEKKPPRLRRRAHLSFKRNGTIYDEEVEVHDMTEEQWNREIGEWLVGVHKRAKAGAQAREPSGVRPTLPAVAPIKSDTSK